MVLSLIILLGLVIFLFITNYDKVRKENPKSNFSIPLWPTFSPNQTIAKFLVLLYSPTVLQAAMVILHSRKKLDFKSGFRPVLLAIVCIFCLFCTISNLVMFLYGEIIITGDTFLKVIAKQSSDVSSLLIQFIFVFISMFHAPLFLFKGRESTFLFLI